VRSPENTGAGRLLPESRQRKNHCSMLPRSEHPCLCISLLLPSKIHIFPRFSPHSSQHYRQARALGLVRPLKNVNWSGASLILPAGGSLPHKPSPIGSISTRRFALRPSAVVLGITGFVPPRPAVLMRCRPIPFPAKYVFTAVALNSETVLL
jgi:hypothetical protein